MSTCFGLAVSRFESLLFRKNARGRHLTLVVIQYVLRNKGLEQIPSAIFIRALFLSIFDFFFLDSKVTCQISYQMAFPRTSTLKRCECRKVTWCPDAVRATMYGIELREPKFTMGDSLGSDTDACAQRGKHSNGCTLATTRSSPATRITSPVHFVLERTPAQTGKLEAGSNRYTVTFTLQWRARPDVCMPPSTLERCSYRVLLSTRDKLRTTIGISSRIYTPNRSLLHTKLPTIPAGTDSDIPPRETASAKIYS